MSNWLVLLDGRAVPPVDLIGGKAASLGRMRQLGLPVPPAFVLTTDACRAYFDGGGKLPAELDQLTAEGIAHLEEALARQFGAGPSPLLVSVRSGAPVSMPGMMDTVLNLGMNDEVEAALAAETGDPAFAADTHTRFRSLFGRVVLKTDRPAPDAIPADPAEQLRMAIAAVFDSSRSRRARSYKKHCNLPDDMGTAVTVQGMVFGNLDDRSGTGVLFTRNPLSGAAEPYGEYLARGQGEDVVSGCCTPQPLSALAEQLPHLHTQLLQAGAALEHHGRDAQDIEFTVQRGELFLLQTRSAKRSPEAAVRMAVEMVDQGLITREQALERVSPEQIRLLLRPHLAPGAADGAEVLATGEPACPGVGAGVCVSDPDEAQERAERGEQVVLVRESTSPEDVHGMIAATAVITETGGSTSHAAVVSRQLGRPCVVGCGSGTVSRLAGQTATVDGDNGTVFAGRLPIATPDAATDPRLSRLRAWADEATVEIDLRDALAGVPERAPAVGGAGAPADIAMSRQAKSHDPERSA
jgi:pyruvate,orthophosphate dikinase